MPDPRVTVYTTWSCGYCRAAKSLLTRAGVPFREIDLSDDPEALMEIKTRTGHATVPLILVDERLLGGYDELSLLVRKQGVDALR